MESRYEPEFIDELLNRVDLVDVIHGHVSLKKTGKNYSACCPFHEESTPSFTVEPFNQFYYCFGCGASGNAINFLMNHQGLSFPAVVRQLADTVNLPLPDTSSMTDEQKKDYARKKETYSLLARAETYYQEQMERLPEVKKYLTERNVSSEMIKTFGLGGASSQWVSTVKRFGGADNKEALVDSGLAIYRQAVNGEKEKLYDRFRGGLIFPIRDERGRTVSFARRYIESMNTNDNRPPPKYINGEETICFSKKAVLYGLHESLSANSQPENIYVLEGYMDVIKHHQHGLTGSVATMGTTISTAAVRRLFRYTPNVTFIFDGDKAGQEALTRALHASLPEAGDSRATYFVSLPQGDDPDTLLQRLGTEAYQQYIKEHATPMSEHLLTIALKGNERLDSIESRAQFFANAKAMLDMMPPCNTKALILSRVHELSGMRPTEYLPYSIELAEGALNGVDIGALESEIKDFIADKINAPAADIKVNWSIPEIDARHQPDHVTIDPNKTNKDSHKEMRLRMGEIKRLLSFETPVAQGISLMKLINTAMIKTGDPTENQVLARGLLSRYLRDNPTFTINCQLVVHHLKEVRSALTHLAPALAESEREDIARLFQAVSQRSAAIPLLREFMGSGSAHKVDTLASEMNVVAQSIITNIRATPEPGRPQQQGAPAHPQRHDTVQQGR